MPIETWLASRAPRKAARKRNWGSPQENKPLKQPIVAMRILRLHFHHGPVGGTTLKERIALSRTWRHLELGAAGRTVMLTGPGHPSSSVSVGVGVDSDMAEKLPGGLAVRVADHVGVGVDSDMAEKGR